MTLPALSTIKHGVTIGHTRYTVRKQGVTGYAIYRERGRLVEPILTGLTSTEAHTIVDRLASR